MVLSRLLPQLLAPLLDAGYPLARAALFKLEPEAAHALTLKTLQAQAYNTTVVWCFIFRCVGKALDQH